MSYCSTDCQVTDWKNKEVPHRQACPVIQRAAKEGGIDVNVPVVFWLLAKRRLLNGDFNEAALEIFGKWGEEGDKRRKNPFKMALPGGLDASKLKWSFSNDSDSD